VRENRIVAVRIHSVTAEHRALPAEAESAGGRAKALEEPS
jgi:hypothetical protein